MNITLVVAILMAKGIIRFKLWKVNVEVVSPKAPLLGDEKNTNKSYCIAQISAIEMMVCIKGKFDSIKNGKWLNIVDRY